MLSNKRVNDAEVFLFKPARIRLGIEEDKQGLYPDKNKVSRRIRPLESKTGGAGTGQRRLGFYCGNGSAESGSWSWGRRPVACATLVVEKGLGRRFSPKRRALTKSMFKLRPYQQEALAALEKYWSGGGGNPLVVMATATGKSVIIAHLIRDVSQRYPAFRVLVVTHTLELVEQDAEHLLALWPDAPIKSTAREIGQREWNAPIAFAGVQSVWRNAGRLGPRHLVLIDEAHLVPHAGDGMSRNLLSELRALAPADGMRIAILGDAVSARQRPA